MKASKQALSLVNLIKNQPKDSDSNSVSFGCIGICVVSSNTLIMRQLLVFNCTYIIMYLA